MNSTVKFAKSFAQGSQQALSDIAEFGMPYGRAVAKRMRRGSNTPYADGYCVRVFEESMRRSQRATRNDH